MDCFVCCGSLEIFAKYSCTHTICHKCAVKLIFFYGDKTCPFCKSSQGKPTFDLYADSSPEGETRPYTEDAGAFYASEAVHKKIKGLLLKKCKWCKRVCKSGDDLIKHFRDAHGKLLCPTCVSYNRQFWFDVVAYDPESLEKHKRGLLAEAGFTGHAFCVHCKTYFYNKEEAKKHCQAEHQLCTVCDILGKKLQFYRNYGELEQHYRARHYCCTDSLCVRNLCYVYAYKSELWTHCLTQHSLNIQLTDIKLVGRENPPVCSIGDAEEGDAFAVYRQEPNITTPLINEPYFPSFGATSAVPSFMSREILSQSVQARETRLRQIRLFTKTFCNEINSSIEKYIEGSKDFGSLISELEAAVGKQATLQMLENISFMHRAKEVKEQAKEYRKAVMFPAFQKSEGKTPTTERRRPGPGSLIPGFKILDLSKKK